MEAWYKLKQVSKEQVDSGQAKAAICLAMDPAKCNLSLSPIGGETASNFRGDKIFIRSKHEDLDPSLSDDDPNVKRRRLTTIEPKDLIGRTFLKESEQDGQRFQAQVVRAIVDKEFDLKQNPEYVRFLCEVPKSTSDEILTYNEVLDHIEKEQNKKENDTEYRTTVDLPSHCWTPRTIA
jgi:hypothetical protein